MAIYRITRTDSVRYEEYDGVVVRAASAKAALALVTGEKTMKHGGFREDGSNLSVERVPGTGDAAVILASFTGA